MASSRQTEALYRRLIMSVFLFFAVFLIGSLGYWVIGLCFEGPEATNDFSLLNSIYMAAITVTTVGYGEATNYHALTGGGREVGVVFTTVYVIFAYLAVVYASANIVAALVEGAVGQVWQRRKMEKLLAKIKDHYIVCGAGTTGHHIVEELVKTGHPVVVIDSDEHALRDAPGGDDVIRLTGDASEDELLYKARIETAAGIFASLPTDKDNLVITLTARHINPKIRIISRVTRLGTRDKMARIGANSTISPNHIGGLRMASEMLRPSVVTFLDTMLRQSTSTMRFSEVPIVEGDAAADKTLQQIDAFGAVGLSVIGIVRADKHIIYNPKPTETVATGDALIVMADNDALVKVRDHLRAGVK